MRPSLGRLYVRHIKDCYGRTVTFREGRYKLCLVESENYLMRFDRYVEPSPVRAQMVASPADYDWSRFHRNANLREDSLVYGTPYQRLGSRASAAGFVMNSPRARLVLQSTRSR